MDSNNKKKDLKDVDKTQYHLIPDKGERLKKVMINQQY